MAVTDLNLVQVRPQEWEILMASDGADPTFRIKIDNTENEISTKKNTYRFILDKDDEPSIQVTDDANDEFLPAFPNRATIRWPRVASTDYYKVEEYYNSVWTERARVYDDGQRRVYEWRSRPLEDVTTHQFRVTAVGTNGNSSSAASLSILMVRRPDVPRVNYRFNTGRTVTITAAE